jgi:hypothetical protein
MQLHLCRPTYKYNYMFHDSITVFYLLVLLNFINLFFKILTYYSSADFSGWLRQKGKSRNPFDIIISTKFVIFFLNFGFGGFGVGCSPAAPPPLGCAPCYLRHQRVPLYWITQRACVYIHNSYCKKLRCYSTLPYELPQRCVIEGRH